MPAVPMRSTRPTRALAGAAALVLITSGCLGHTGGGRIPAGSRLVQVYHMAFRPRVVDVRVGQSVTWRFEDAQVDHNVDSPSGGFGSPDQDSGTWTHVFTTPGTFSYFCSIHPYMTGAVVVTPTPTTAGA